MARESSLSLILQAVNNGTSRVRCKCVRLLRHILEFQSPSALNIIGANGKGGILEFLFDLLVKTLGADGKKQPETSLLRDTLPMAFEIVMLFRHLLLSKSWKSSVKEFLMKIIQEAVKTGIS